MTMSYNTGAAPHLRRNDRASLLCLDVLITLLPLTVFSCVYFGIRPVIVLLVSIGSAIGFELLACLLMHRRPPIGDGTAAVTGGLIGALMSPIAPLWLPVIATGFAVLVVKMPFGGNGRNLFNPAAGGLAFVTVCFPHLLFLYPDPGRPLDDLATVITAKSPAALLRSGGESLNTLPNMLLGNFPGPIGAVAIAILIACALYLFSRRSASPLITLSYVAVCAAGAILFPRAGNTWLSSLMLELCSGYLLFTGIFLLNDPVTAPRHWLARILYGALAGALVMCLRHVGQYEEGCCFAVLLINLFATVLDRGCWQLTHRLRQWWQYRKGGVRT